MKPKQKVMTPEELRKMQLIQVELLAEFDRVCRKNNIKYILDAGTLLGAVRYGKFIPWDDDIDVRMLRSEYKKFSKIAPYELDKRVFFQDHRTDKEYPWLYGKLRRNGTKAVRVGQEKLKMHSGVFIDIFPCDGVPKNRIAQKFQSLLAAGCRKSLYACTAKYMADTRIQRILWTIINLIPNALPHACISGLAWLFDDRKCSLVGCMGWHAPKDVNGFRKDWFTELTNISFEGREFMAPKDWDGFLTYSFGSDYMIPPPVEQQKASSPLSFYSLEV